MRLCQERNPFGSSPRYHRWVEGAHPASAPCEPGCGVHPGSAPSLPQAGLTWRMGYRDPTCCSPLYVSQLVISVQSSSHWRPRKSPCSHRTQLQGQDGHSGVTPGGDTGTHQPGQGRAGLGLTHIPPLTRTDSTWLLKPSACRLLTSVFSSISFPSKHSSPCRKMEGSEKNCG